MRADNNRFSSLAQRASSGDPTAAGQLGRELEPQLVHIVRRVVRAGAGRSALDRRILAEATRLGLTAESAAGATGEFLIRQVACSVCDVVLAGVRSAADRCRSLQDTVCT